MIDPQDVQRVMEQKIKEGIEKLRPLTNSQLIMLSLAEIIGILEDIPPSKRCALVAELGRRSGVRP